MQSETEPITAPAVDLTQIGPGPHCEVDATETSPDQQQQKRTSGAHDEWPQKEGGEEDENNKDVDDEKQRDQSCLEVETQIISDSGSTSTLSTSKESTSSDTCRATVYMGPQENVEFKLLQRPRILEPTDGLIKVIKTTICGTDLHIMRGNVSSVAPFRRLGHEGIGEIVELGAHAQASEKFKIGDRVLISTVTSCGKCKECSKAFYGHCDDGGWVLGNTIDGMQGEYARIPHIDTSCYFVPPEWHDTEIEDGLVMCSDILPTSLEVGLLDGGIEHGQDTVAIVGLGPVGLATLIGCAVYEPKTIFVIDLNPHRLQSAANLGQITGLENTTIVTIDNTDGTAVAQIMEKTNNRGVDLIVECVGNPAAWYICQYIVRAGGHIAILGVHGAPATINLEQMWNRNFRMSAGLVHGYTIQSLMDRVIQGNLDAQRLISHRMKLSEMEKCYEMFTKAEEYQSLKILIINDL